MPARGTGWPGSAAAPAWSPGPYAWSRPRSRSSPASRTTAGSTNSYLCEPETLRKRTAAEILRMQSRQMSRDNLGRQERMEESMHFKKHQEDIARDTDEEFICLF